MAKQVWKPGNMLYPLPAVLVSVGDMEKNNLFTVAWTGTVCTNPAMVYISVRPERYSYEIIEKKREFVINLTTKDLLKAVDYCGVRSGRDVDKWKEMRLTPVESQKVKAPSLLESPVNIECKVVKIDKLGSHHMFIAKVVSVSVEDELLDSKGGFHLDEADLIAYSHGDYVTTGKKIGSFGFSVKRKKRSKGTTRR